RLAVPPRHASVEKQIPKPVEPLSPTTVNADAWAAYSGGAQFISALQDARAARAVWQALPGESWPQRLAEAAAVTVNSGRGVLAVLPDQRDVDLLYAAAVAQVPETRVVALSAGLGPAERYRRWLAVLRGDARVVIGTRSAVFAPVAELGLVVLWDDGDDSLSEPRAPYPHAREVAMLRAHQLQCAAMIGGYARTAESQALVRSRWAHDLTATRSTVRTHAPRVIALEDSVYAQERDPAARTARLPSVA
ncbi:primosome assembly protein PriA, partial [Mycobacterium sp. ITM-2017-0098]